MTQPQPLTSLDAAFLHVESERTPMHMASVGIFDGTRLYDAEGIFRLDDIRRLIASRLAVVPKLRQCPVPGLFGEAPPVWADDPHFEIANHVRACQLASPGTEVELRRLCGELMAVPLEAARPLWELTFVEGLTEGRVALVEKLHHSMADGLAAAELATVLFDFIPDPPDSVQPAPVWNPSPRPPAWRAAGDDLVRLADLPLRVVKWYGQSIAHPIRRGRELADVGRALGTIVTPRIFAPRSSLNVPITPARSVSFVRLPLEQIHDIGHMFDATINDVLLTMVAGGLRELLGSRGELTEDSELQALIPVGAVDGQGRGLRNSVSALFARLPIGEDDPVAALEAIAAAVGEDKRHHQALAADTFLRLLEPVPQDLLALGTGLIQCQPFFNLIVTNVPGPPVPLYALGARLLEAFPFVPLAGNQSLAVAALSYADQLNVGVLSDPVTCPDAEVFCAGIRSSQKVLLQRVEEAQRP